MHRLLSLTIAALPVIPAAASAAACTGSVCVCGSDYACAYTDRSAFEASVDKAYVEGFESLPTGIIGFDGPAILPSGLAVSSESNRLFVAAPGQSTNPTTAIGSNLPMDDLLRFDLGGEFTAFGADIFQNLGGGAQGSEPFSYELRAYLGGQQVIYAGGSISPDGGGFLGLTWFYPFDSVSLWGYYPESYEVVDNVTVGHVVSPVPLPAGLPLSAAGLGALALLRRRPRA